MELLYARKSSLFDHRTMTALYCSTNILAARWVLDKGFDPCGAGVPALTRAIRCIGLAEGAQPYLFQWLELVWPQLNLEQKKLSMELGLDYLTDFGNASLVDIQAIFTVAATNPLDIWTASVRTKLVIAVSASAEAKQIRKFLFACDDFLPLMDHESLLDLANPTGGEWLRLRELPLSVVLEHCRRVVNQ
jgi:hypothetical protein